MPCHDTRHLLKRCETPPAPVFLVADTPAVKYRNRHCKTTRRPRKTPAPSHTECACADGSRASIDAPHDSPFPPPHTPKAHVPTARAPASTQPTIHACARPTGARWAFDAPPCLHPRTQRGGPARQVKVRRSIAAHSTDANALTQWASVASPIICRSALAIEAHRGVASLANTLGMGCAMRLALHSDGCAQPTTSDRRRDTSSGPLESSADSKSPLNA